MQKTQKFEFFFKATFYEKEIWWKNLKKKNPWNLIDQKLTVLGGKGWFGSAGVVMSNSTG